jgi:hypothetical protein
MAAIKPPQQQHSSPENHPRGRDAYHGFGRFGSLSAPMLDPQRGYDQPVIEDPLKGALEEIAPKLDPELEPLAAALLSEEPVEDAWAELLQEILDAA